MYIKVEQINSLRLQAENALSLANITIKSLEDIIKKLSRSKFGLIFGSIYPDRKIDGLASVMINFLAPSGAFFTVSVLYIFIIRIIMKKVCI